MFGTKRHTQSPTLIVPQLSLCSTNRGIEVDRKMSYGYDAYITGVTKNLEQSTYRIRLSNNVEQQSYPYHTIASLKFLTKLRIPISD
jgi:hypothetical protein